MKIKDHLFYAPGILFRNLNIYSPEIVDKFHHRMESFYLAPARELIGDMPGREPNAFAAVVLLVSCMDAISRYASEDPQRNRGNRDRYIEWLTRSQIASLSERVVATIFYENIRCGVVHEAHAKVGCAFTFQTGTAIAFEKGAMAVNPRFLAVEVENSLRHFCENLRADANELAKFQKNLEIDFAAELA